MLQSLPPLAIPMRSRLAWTRMNAKEQYPMIGQKLPMVFAYSSKTTWPCCKERAPCLPCCTQPTTLTTTLPNTLPCRTKQLQSLVGQFALGLRRLEQDEEREQSTAEAAVLQNPPSHKQRVRCVALRLATAANCSKWTSCCEMALFIRIGTHVRTSCAPRPI